MTRVHDFVSDLATGGKSFKEIKNLVKDCFGPKALSDSQIYRIIAKVRAGEDPKDGRGGVRILK